MRHYAILDETPPTPPPGLKLSPLNPHEQYHTVANTTAA